MRTVRLLVPLRCEAGDMPAGTLVVVERDFHDPVRGQEALKHTLNVLGPAGQALWIHRHEIEELSP